MKFSIIAWPKNKNRKHNPYQSLLYDALEKIGAGLISEFSPSRLILTKGEKILHIHWPDVFLATARGWKFWAKLILLRGLFALTGLLGIPVIWTAHNIKRTGQQNTKLMGRFFWPWFASKIDGIIYMNKSSKIEAEKLFEHWCNVPNTIISHGHYGPIIANINSITPSITNKKPQILFFGSITKYKNANKLLETFLDLPVGLATLKIKGKMSEIEPDNKLLNILKNMSYDQKENVFFEDRFLDDKELVQAVTESELVVFPYSEVLNSGAAIFALSIGRPILVSDTPLFRELQEKVGEDWVRLIKTNINADMLLFTIRHAQKLKASKAKPDLSLLAWDLIAKQTQEFYRDVLSAKTEKGN